MTSVERYMRYVRFRTPRSWVNIYPIHVELSAAHWGDCPWTRDGEYDDGTPRYRGVQHDECPKDWPWWRLVAFYWCDLQPRKPSTGRRLWIYTRRGSLHCDLYVDRRGEM